ncbi:MAG TPA: C40 family peptidase [Pyrinomonadaceae bacterium]|jgi:peptidoglycan endopeptidase LytE
MPFTKLFPRALAACFALGLLATNAAAQTEISRPRLATTPPTTVSAVPNGSTATRLENEPVVISVAPEAEAEAFTRSTLTPRPSTLHVEQVNEMLLAAIETRIGTPYRLGTEGPYRYDCSGFVWSVFQSAGITFERTNARSLWSRFAPARGDERFQFGTLVFFNNLNHIGIVADAGGFYHASTSKGVVYSPFNEYWSSRIDGFRRIPLANAEVAAVGR